MEEQALSTTIDDPLAVANKRGWPYGPNRPRATAAVPTTTGATGKDAERKAKEAADKAGPRLPKQKITHSGIIGSAEPENESAGIISPIGQSTAFEASPTYTGVGSQSYEVTQDELVSEQLDRLLNKNNSYLQRARASAAQQANSRGLLNSSIAAGSGEAAAIDAALPIAQQDAGHYQALGQAKQQGIIDSFQRAQAALDQAGLYGTQSAYESLLSKQESGQQKELQKQIDAAAGARLSKELNTKMKMQELEVAAQLEMQAKEIAAQFGLTEMESDLKKYLAELEIGSNEKISLGDNITDMNQQMMVEIGSVLGTDQLSLDGKLGALGHLTERYNAGVQLTSSLFDSVAFYDSQTSSIQASLSDAYKTSVGGEPDTGELNYYTELVSSGGVPLSDATQLFISATAQK